MIYQHEKKTQLEVAESYVEWAARHKISASSTVDAITNWRHLHLDRNEKEYIKVLANRNCPHPKK